MTSSAKSIYNKYLYYIWSQVHVDWSSLWEWKKGSTCGEWIVRPSLRIPSCGKGLHHWLWIILITTTTTTFNSFHLLFCHQTMLFSGDKPSCPDPRSRYVHKLEFIEPDSEEGIPVYRVLNREGKISDESQDPKVCCIIFIVMYRILWTKAVIATARLSTADVFRDFNRQKKSCLIVLMKNFLRVIEIFVSLLLKKTFMLRSACWHSLWPVSYTHLTLPTRRTV